MMTIGITPLPMDHPPEDKTRIISRTQHVANFPQSRGRGFKILSRRDVGQGARGRHADTYARIRT